MSETSPQKTSAPAQNAPTASSSNITKPWDDPRLDWAREQVQKAQGHLLAVFDTDDDMPLSRHLLMVSIVAFFVMFFLWASLATLDEVARGEGKVIPSSEVQALQSLEGGIVEEFLVKEGQEVEAGQVLLRMSDIEASSDLGANRVRYLGLRAAIARLEAQAQGRSSVDFPQDVADAAPQSVAEETSTFNAMQQQMQGQLNILEQQLMQREQEIREIETRIGDIRGVLALQQEEMAVIKPLVERGSAPKLELLQLERGIREKTTELNSAVSGLSRAQSAADEARARIEDIRTSARATAQGELSVKVTEMKEIEQRLSALTERKTRTEIRSPVNGTIQEIAVTTIGGVVRPGADVIKIVPRDDQLIVEARIKPSDRAFIYPGQPAVVKITAYDFSIYGGLKGEVVDISADTIEDEKGNSFYRVRLRTFDVELKRKGQILPIVPGMVASADILTGKKTVMQYLLKPFVKTLDVAFTER